jgi:hypothetical protein
MKGERGWPDLSDLCDHFEPSLQCRQVLALEEIAHQLKTGPSQAAVILVNDKGELLAVPQGGQ